MSSERRLIEIGRYCLMTDTSLPSDPHDDYYLNSIGLHCLISGLLDIERIRRSWENGESTQEASGLEFYHALTLDVEGGLEMLTEEEGAVHPDIVEKARKVLEENHELAERLFQKIMENEWGDLLKQAARIANGEEGVPSF